MRIPCRTPARLSDRARHVACWLAISLGCLAVAGCGSYGNSQLTAARPLGTAPVLVTPVAAVVTADPGAAQAALDEAQRLDRQDDPAAVDRYFQAAVLAAEGMPPGATSAASAQSESVYRQALWGLIDAGQRLGRLDPRGQLSVAYGGQQTIPLRYFGFAWKASDFSRLSAADVPTGDIARRYVRPGLGIPLLGERVSPCEETFSAPWMPFAVTAILRPAGESDGAAGYVLELYNPLEFDCVSWRGLSRPLAADVTAPLAAIVDGAPRQYLRGFTAPSDVRVRPKLLMLEPYQAGKIPVVFIHGLYSDPITWADMLNELRAQRDLYDQFQFWTYRYPTGGDLLASTAALRADLHLVRTTFDPQHRDPALDQMVLVGHSLGGLVAKMQITTSYDLLWREAAVQPFDALRAPPELEAQLARGFFFEPVASVTRVVFIGTPHRGSGMTRRAAGRVGNLLVRFDSEQDAQYQQLLAANRDVFKPFLQGRRPTTISLLEPDNPFLNVLERLPINCQTRLHSVIGTGGLNPAEGPGDGVVPIESAEHAGDSALEVPARHERLHRDPATIAEVTRILRLHAASVR